MVPLSYILLIYYQLFVIDLYIWHLTMYKYVMSPNRWFLISVLNIESKKNFNILEKNRCFYLMLYKHLCVRTHRNPWTKNLLFLKPYSKKFLFPRITLEIVVIFLIVIFYLWCYFLINLGICIIKDDIPWRLRRNDSFWFLANYDLSPVFTVMFSSVHIRCLIWRT